MAAVTQLRHIQFHPSRPHAAARPVPINLACYLTPFQVLETSGCELQSLRCALEYPKLKGDVYSCFSPANVRLLAGTKTASRERGAGVVLENYALEQASCAPRYVVSHHWDLGATGVTGLHVVETRDCIHLLGRQP